MHLNSGAFWLLDYQIAWSHKHMKLWVATRDVLSLLYYSVYICKYSHKLYIQILFLRYYYCQILSTCVYSCFCFLISNDWQNFIKRKLKLSQCFQILIPNSLAELFWSDFRVTDILHPNLFLNPYFEQWQWRIRFCQQFNCFRALHFWPFWKFSTLLNSF